jgi:hypothetical protein
MEGFLVMAIINRSLEGLYCLEGPTAGLRHIVCPDGFGGRGMGGEVEREAPIQ